MAIPIKDTPTLHGKDSIKFNEEVKSKRDNRISAAEYEETKELVEKILDNSNL